MTATASKAVPKAQYLRHPFTKQRLRVIDTFVPNKPVECPVCSEMAIDKISIVEPEYRGGIRYHVLACGSCDKQNWVVFLS